MKRGKVVIAFLVAMLCIPCVVVNAQTIYTSNNTLEVKPFEDKWYISTSFSVPLDSTVTLYAQGTYGYDTWAWNEDYIKNVYTSLAGYKVRGRVINGAGSAAYTDYAVYGGQTGKADVLHDGAGVRYNVQFVHQ